MVDPLNPNVVYVGGSLRSGMRRHQLFPVVERTGIRVSRDGLGQALEGKAVTRSSDRAALAGLLELIARPEISAILVSLLAPAVQKCR